MVAAARALVSKQPDPLIVDPFAAPLVRAVGIEFFTRLADGEISLSEDKASTAALMTTVMAVRTKFFDDFFLTATESGIRQAVILAAGLDSRPYRLPWPDGTVVYEIDQPKVIEFKTATMTDIGATPTAQRRTVAIDLRDDWPAALRRSGFDETQPTAWSAEGLLAYLPPEAQDRLFDNITALSPPGSQLATEFHPDVGAGMGERAAAMRSEWQQHGFDVDLSQLFYAGERTPVVDHLSGHGWQVSASPRPEVFARYGKEFPDTDELAPQRNSLAIIATRK
jgi:methyltransferase (TIGR00027 family)